jgi:3-oxoacyl-[acyl-carrier-protein] synthase II
MTMSERRVAITGFGMITPLGKNTDLTFSQASKGLSGVDYIKSFVTEGLPCTIGGEVENSWIEELLPPAARRVNAYSSRGLRLMMVATREAAERAKLDKVENRDRIGVALGSHGDTPAIDDIQSLQRFYDGSGNWDIPGLCGSGGYSSLNFFRRKPDALTALLSMVFNCKGPNLSFVSACAAGAQAVGEAYRVIREGSADIMVAGGCEASLNFTGFIGFVLIKALVEKYATPQKASRPFDRKRNGFVMSEGAGALILEDLEHALKRGAPVLGEILGYGDSADAYRITDTHPKGEGAVLAMKAALDDAGLTADDIEYINAHGTSTLQNDLTETRAIKAVFGDRAAKVPVSSNKSMLGHTIAAAGAIESIMTLVGMHRSVILPTINQESHDPKCDLDYVPNEARVQSYRLALSNSFGFGGQNACLCIGAFEG